MGALLYSYIEILNTTGTINIHRLIVTTGTISHSYWALERTISSPDHRLYTATLPHQNGKLWVVLFQ